MDDKTTILCFLLVLPGLVAAALIFVQVQNFGIRAWRQTNGRIVASRNEAREVRKTEHRTAGGERNASFVTEETLETRNFAMIGYEFKVDGKSYQGSRIDLGVDSGNSEVAEKLRRYPIGKVVPVIYDPADPSQCILERVDPKKIRAGWFAVVVLVALIVGGIYGGGALAALARGAMPRPGNLPLVVFIALFALVLLGFARMIALKGRQMRSWKHASGEIVASAVATTERTETSSNSSRSYSQTIYVPRIVFQFAVEGVSYSGDNIGAIVSASIPGPATQCVARFPLNKKVDVFYNPDAPTESALDIRVGYAPLILRLLAALVGFGALAVAGWIPGL
jgi:hypothetical protein